MENIIEVYVTRKDLKQPYLNPQDCPIATSIKRTLKIVNVIVGGVDVYINGSSYKLRSEDDRKAHMRGSGRLLGKLLGGFKVVLHKRPWT